MDDLFLYTVYMYLKSTYMSINSQSLTQQFNAAS